MKVNITEEDIMRLAKAYAIHNFTYSNSDKKDYWKQVVVQLAHTKIQIMKGE